jgi:hypothetical protein
MKEHYQDVVDEVFGFMYRHRTLRTLFDPCSSEWEEYIFQDTLPHFQGRQRDVWRILPIHFYTSHL